jgi:hypothetical protein
MVLIGIHSLTLTTLGVGSPSPLVNDKVLKYRGGKNFCRENSRVKISVPNSGTEFFPAFFKNWDRIFPAILRMVKIYLHKGFNYWQNTKKNPALRAG